MKKVLGLLGLFGILSVHAIPSAIAATPLIFRHKHFLFTVDPAAYPQWRSAREQWTVNGSPIDPSATWRVDGDDVPPLPAGVERGTTFTWNRSAIRSTLEKVVGNLLARPAGDVTISRDARGKIAFRGVGLTGRAVDLDPAAALTEAALERGLTEIELPVIETQPTVRVEDPALAAQGIREVVTIGESTFAGSPANRRHNIGVGLRRFNGALIPAGSAFSFNAVLGRVDASTGYLEELVIKGDRTEPDYGGGLCQISTTAYRGVWEYGFPILKRRNHSYTVRYYAPPGTDATVYPGAIDMVFRNDLPTALLIQTHQEHDRAYYIYYGTRDDRTTEILGPFVYDRAEPPRDRTELTLDLPPGETKKLNERVPGLKALWYRFVTSGSGTVTSETVASHYEARPLFTALGVAELPEGYATSSSASAPLSSSVSSKSSAATKSSSSARLKPSMRRQ